MGGGVHATTRKDGLYLVVLLLAQQDWGICHFDDSILISWRDFSYEERT
jgi:hypothetical protein